MAQFGTPSRSISYSFLFYHNALQILSIFLTRRKKHAPHTTCGAVRMVPYSGCSFS
ncbi:hypothetical protein BCO26_2803 [Heyndrickxia coagulans 2-6]|nr:hypothetical protein BCO26_2803 [Heyndrickxia coagulans 2-6]